MRKLVDDNGFNWKDKAPFDESQTIGAALLQPTRIYVKSTLAAIRKTGAVKALAHITGGGLTENIPRVLPDDLAANLDLTSITLPAVFNWLSKLGSIDEAELVRTFNCGVGMVLVVDKDKVDEVITILKAEGESAFSLGSLSARNGEAVIYQGSLT